MVFRHTVTGQVWDRKSAGWIQARKLRGEFGAGALLNFLCSPNVVVLIIFMQFVLNVIKTKLLPTKNGFWPHILNLATGMGGTGACWGGRMGWCGLKGCGSGQKFQPAQNSTTYIPCTAQSLNLAGNSASHFCSAVRFFFEFAQKLYSFFTTQCWGSLLKHQWWVWGEASEALAFPPFLDPPSRCFAWIFSSFLVKTY